MHVQPTNFMGVFTFYKNELQPCYNDTFVLTTLPIQLLERIFFAFDNMSAYYLSNTDEATCEQAMRLQLKIASFDAVKALAKEIGKKAVHLRRIDTSIVDSGCFDKKHDQLLVGLQEVARQAKDLEKKADCEEDEKKKIQLYEEAYEKHKLCRKLCEQYDSEFYLNDNIEWARSKRKDRSWREIAENFVITIVAGIFCWLIIIYSPAQSFLKLPVFTGW